MFAVGYTTGTFDLTHEGHFRILRAMKTRCARLVVGLTSDALGQSQKRRPHLSYEHRRTILLHSKYVDSVVEHVGLSKEEDYRRLRFDVLFIGADYRDSLEYKTFAAAYPSIPVVYLPRTEGVSTTDIITTQGLNITDPSILTWGVQGPLWRLDKQRVLKCVPVASKEFASTADVYRYPLPRPRNWKDRDMGGVRVPNIPAVNTMREVQIFHDLKDYVWYPVTHITTLWSRASQPPIGMDGRNKTDDYMSCSIQDRSTPVHIYGLYQRYGGVTFNEWWGNSEHSSNDRVNVWNEIAKILEILRERGIVHGDLHGGNICVDIDNRVTLLDFGWCTSNIFDMDEEERAEHEYNINNRFDQSHLVNSLIRERVITCPPSVFF